MSSGNPGDGLTDRPKMAEALASLKEGLSETDDPLYDGWKLRPGAGAVTDNLAAAGEAANPAADGTDTVPVRVVRYLVFPKWALVVAAALVAFAAIVTVVRVDFRTSEAPSTAASAAAAESAAVPQSESAPLLPAYPKTAASGTPAVVGTVRAPVRRRVRDKKAKTQDPGFFHEPGF